MKKQILTREDFITEIYSQKQPYEEVNEGIFDFFKSVLGKEWNSIKSKNASLKDALKNVDKSLGGFSFMKMSKAGTCKEIRQVVCDFANDLLAAKMKEFEDGEKLQKTLMGLKNADEISSEDKKAIENAGKVSDYLRKFDLKDKALVDKLATHEKRIKTICDGDPGLTKWSNLLMDGVRNIINDAIIKEYEKSEKGVKKEELEKAKKAIEDQQKKEEEDRKKKNEEEKKAEEKKLKDVEVAREKMISNSGATPIKGQTGDKAYATLNAEFAKIHKVLESEEHQYSFENIINEKMSKEDKAKKLEDLKKALKSDAYLGMSGLADIEELKWGQLKAVVKIINVIFNKVNEIVDDGKKLKDTPSDAVQALYIGLSKLIQAAYLTNDGKLSDDTLELLARCAIDKDKTLGYGLPLIDPKKPKAGNVFVSITSALTEVDKNGEVGKAINDKDTLNRFRKNVIKMFDDIRKKAEELKGEREKEDEKEAKKAEEDVKKANKK